MSASPLDESKAKNVLRQVEFYFSDSNLPRDNFLRKTVEESEDGLVSLALICSFSRMKSHLGLAATMTQEAIPEKTVLAVAEVLRQSSTLRVSDDGTRIGRATELLEPDEVAEQVDSRTIAASPLPYNIQLEDVQSFFSEHAKVNSVRLPRHVSDKRHFCGTALIEFPDEEDAKTILSKSLVFAGVNLELKPKKEFDAEIEKKRAEFEKNRSSKKTENECVYQKGLIVSFMLKAKTADDQTDGEYSKQETATSEDVPISSERPSTEPEDKIVESANSSEEKLTGDDQANNSVLDEQAAAAGNSVIANKMRDDENVISREDLKAIFQKFGSVKYVDFRIGEESGFIRFEDPKAAEKARAFAVLNDNGGIVVKNKIAILEALSGEAEKEYWSKISTAQGKYKGNQNSKGRGGGWNNRGGRQHFNAGKRGRHQGPAAPNKSQKKAEASAATS